MKISIWSKNLANISASEREIIREAVKFYAYKLMTPRLADSLTITVNVVQDMYKNTKNLGDCCPTDDERYPKEFEINLERTKRLKRMLFSLAHEMVHVKQYAKGELKFHDRGNVVTFQKKKYDDENYWESPWEIEAYGREPGLFMAFKSTYRRLLRESKK